MYKRTFFPNKKRVYVTVAYFLVVIYICYVNFQKVAFFDVVSFYSFLITYHLFVTLFFLISFSYIAPHKIVLKSDSLEHYHWGKTEILLNDVENVCVCPRWRFPFNYLEFLLGFPWLKFEFKEKNKRKYMSIENEDICKEILMILKK